MVSFETNSWIHTAKKLWYAQQKLGDKVLKAVCELIDKMLQEVS